MQLSESYLQDHSSTTLMQRGESYLQHGHLKAVVKRGKTYYAKVGRDEVEITLSDSDEPQMLCTCPWHKERLCKHQIALALSILRNPQSIVKGPFQEVEPKAQTQSISAEEVETNWQNASAETREAFLRQLLAKDDRIQARFIQFVQAEKPLLRLIELSDVRSQIVEAYRNANFDEPEELANGSYQNGRAVRYVDDFDAGYEWAMRKFERILDPWIAEGKRLVQAGNIYDAIQIWVACYEGQFFVRQSSGDKWDFFIDYHVAVRDEYNRLSDALLKEMEVADFGEQDAKYAIDLLLSRWVYWEKQKSGWNINQVDFRLDVFEELLEELLLSEQLGEHLYSEIIKQTKGEIPQPLVRTQMLAAERMADEEVWRQTAEALIADVDTAGRLLRYYENRNQQAEWNRVAKKVAEFRVAHFVDYFLPRISIESHPEIYLQCLKSLVQEQGDAEAWEKARPHLSEEERRIFIQQQQYKPIVYVQLLKIEGWMEEALEYIKKQKGNIRYVEMLRLVMDECGEDVFEMLKERVNHLMSRYRGRDIYTMVCEWLKLMREIPKMKAQVRMYLHGFARYNQRLQPLLELMKEEGLLEDQSLLA